MRKPNYSENDQPFPSMESIGSNRSTADAIIERASQYVPTRVMPGFHSRSVSEAASDQGHGGLIEGHRKPSELTNDGDLPHETPVFDPFIDSLEAFKPGITEGIGKTAVHEVMAEVEAKNILMQADGDAIHAAALTRARQEKPRD